TFESADAYYAHLADHMGAEDHAAIRRRAAEVASPGHDAVVSDLRGRLERLEPRLAAAGPEHRLAVVGGAVMRLGDYLATRIVEQVVHLDDLARSVAVDLSPTPERCVQTALAVGTAIGRRRFGDAAMVRALYRRTDASPLPVL
ncbi:MAG TPA: maleylpyruvate isomerase N-terminal domain-containing protein, partial [Acidimicrobiales bacterium]|nr:maleylpyruvate isomerase N-terminal domain-containing protein [Acidimicrobiales bacterium]